MLIRGPEICHVDRCPHGCTSATGCCGHAVRLRNAQYDPWFVPLPAAKDVPAAGWRFPETVADLIHNLSTLDPTLPIYGAYFVDINGRKHARIKSITLSRERVEGIQIKTGEKTIPYSVVLWSSLDARAAAPQRQQVQTRKTTKPPRRCAAGRDGDCIHAMCPQLRDGEPAKSGRHCPLDTTTGGEHAERA